MPAIAVSISVQQRPMISKAILADCQFELQGSVTD